MGRGNKKAKTVVISSAAQAEIDSILEYIRANWSQKAVDSFLQKLENFRLLVALHPHLFRFYKKRKNIRRYVLSKRYLVFYRSKRSSIEIISVFDTRQDPTKLRRI